MYTDPYLIKRFPRYHPKRLVHKAWERASETLSGLFYEAYLIPNKDCPFPLPDAPQADWSDTQVTPEQARYLLSALSQATMANMQSRIVVEVGSWRGVTTAYLAEAAASSSIIAIDPFIGPGNEVNLHRFERRTAPYRNIHLLRTTFGAAVRDWPYGTVGFIFIDAAHDYPNVRHDLAAASRIAREGAMIALHDVDNPSFPGCRRAVYEQLKRFEVIAHVDNLVILQENY